jgi:hypothetical protein
VVVDLDLPEASIAEDGAAMGVEATSAASSFVADAAMERPAYSESSPRGHRCRRHI